jgi:hypothetical protein
MFYFKCSYLIYQCTRVNLVFDSDNTTPIVNPNLLLGVFERFKSQDV